MKVTTLGIITALKNFGFWLSTTWLLVDIQANLAMFIYAVIIYVLVIVPSDVYMLNKAHEATK